MIESVQKLDILEELRRGHHVFIDVPFEGGQAALDYYGEHGQGYGLLVYLRDEHPSLQVPEIPAHKNYTGDWSDAKELLGDMFTWEDENEGVTWHFVYTHTTVGGHLPDPYWDWELPIAKLDAWWEEHEEDIPMHGVHAVLFGSGVHHSRVGEYRSKSMVMLKILADTEMPIDLRHL